jgi:predicted transcriptional regulator
MIRSVRLDDETNELLERAARETGQTPSELIRRSVREKYGPAGKRTFYERIEHLIGSVDSGTGPAAERRRRRTDSRRTGEAFAELLLEQDRRRRAKRAKAGRGKRSA